MVLVDCRTVPEQAVSVIPTAISRPSFEAREEAFLAAARADPSFTVVPYCTVGARSGSYARKLVARGFPQAQVVSSSGGVKW